MDNHYFDGKSVLITGGTGSFGSAFSRYLLDNTSVERLVILSRKWQDQRRLEAELNHDSRLRLFIGDIREKDRLLKAFHNVDVVIHAAAIKDVVLGQYNPEEIIRTNIIGSMNVFDAAIEAGVKKVFFVSSDKACAPYNLYGISKAAAEQAAIQWNSYGTRKTMFSCGRWGNVLGSAGSVLPLWKDRISRGLPIQITDPSMTRFWFPMSRVVAYVSRCVETMIGGECFIPKLKASTIGDLITAFSDNEKVLTTTTGIRPGEKIHESMISADEISRTIDLEWTYIIKPFQHDWSKHWNIGGSPYPLAVPFTSENAERYTVDELRELVWGD